MTDAAKSPTSTVMTGVLTAEERRARLLAYRDATPEVREATRRARRIAERAVQRRPARLDTNRKLMSIDSCSCRLILQAAARASDSGE